MRQLLIPVLLSAFLGPGAGQLYNRNYKKGFFLLTVVLLGLVGLFAAFVVIAKEEIIKSEEILLMPGFEAALAQKIMQEHSLPLTLFKWGFVVIWCYSVVDAYLVGSRKRGTTVTVAQMQEIDRRSETEFGVSSLRLMENAGRAVAQEILKIIKDSPLGQSLIIVCGKGNNGGDGMAVARYLHAANIPVKVFCVESLNKPPKPEVKTQIEKLKEGVIEPVAFKEGQKMGEASFIVDALLGTGSQGEPTGLIKTLIDEINSAKKPVLSVDIPSGLDADTGKASSSCVRAQWTVTLGLAKVGLLKEQAKPYVGKLIVVDIGHPKKLLFSLSPV